MKLDDYLHWLTALTYTLPLHKTATAYPLPIVSRLGLGRWRFVPVINTIQDGIVTDFVILWDHSRATKQEAVLVAFSEIQKGLNREHRLG